MNIEFSRAELSAIKRYHTNKIKAFVEFLSMADEKDIKKMLSFLKEKCRKEKIDFIKTLFSEA